MWELFCLCSQMTVYFATLLHLVRALPSLLRALSARLRAGCSNTVDAVNFVNFRDPACVAESPFTQAMDRHATAPHRSFSGVPRNGSGWQPSTGSKRALRLAMTGT